MRAADPNSAVGFQNALTALKPFMIELVVELRAARFVPIAFIHLDHLPGVAGDAAVGKKIRGIGENGVESALRVFGGDGVEEPETIAVIETEEWAVAGEY